LGDEDEVIGRIEFRESCKGLDWSELDALFVSANLEHRRGPKQRRAFENSGCVCLAYDDGRLVGVCRAITDGEYHAFIYDVAVHPDWQGRGLGKALMRRLLSRLPVWRVMLVADEAVQGFYRGLGFALYGDVMALRDRSKLEEA
jgi:ribosomal protein S18 acetylase RimI-like enzyme